MILQSISSRDDKFKSYGNVRKEILCSQSNHWFWFFFSINQNPLVCFAQTQCQTLSSNLCYSKVWKCKRWIHGSSTLAIHMMNMFVGATVCAIIIAINEFTKHTKVSEPYLWLEIVTCINYSLRGSVRFRFFRANFDRCANWLNNVVHLRREIFIKITVTFRGWQNSCKITNLLICHKECLNGASRFDKDIRSQPKSFLVSEYFLGG